MSEWIERPLGCLAEITSGGTPSRDMAEYWGGDIPWVTPTDITACSTNYLSATTDHITKKGLLNSSAKMLPAGSVLFTSRATIGISRIAGVPVCTNQGFKSLTPLNGVDGTFLFYQVQRLRGEFERFAAGSTFPEINKKDTARVSIPHPARPLVQRKIAAILTATDTAIEKTEALIAKYQQIKAGLMHDLFTRGVLPGGQLRPPRSEVPELYQETAIGWIPREWVVCSVGNFLADIQTGKSPSCREVPATSGDWGVLKVSAVHPSGFRSDQNKMVESIRLIEPSFEVKAGDLLITRANTPELVGLLCLVENPQPKLMLCDKTLRLIVTETVFSKPFMFLSLQQHHVHMQIENVATGTSMSMKIISQNAIRGIRITRPVLDEQLDAVALIEKLSKRLRTEETKAEKLRSQKLGLMQDLLTSKLPVKVGAGETAIDHKEPT